MARKNRNRLLSLSVLICLFSATSKTSANTFEIISSGESKLGIDGSFSNFLAPTVNSIGTVVFNARLSNTSDGNLDDSGIYRFYVPPPTLAPVITQFQEVIRENQTVAISGVNYTVNDVFLTSHRLEDAPLPMGPVIGQFSALALRLPIRSGLGTGNSALIVEDDQGNFNLVAAAGIEVPNGNGTFREFNIFSMSDTSADGGVTFFSALDGTENGDLDNTAIFRYSPTGVVSELARRGNMTGSGGNFAAVSGAQSNDFGGAVFIGIDDLGDPSTDTALYRVSSTGVSANQLISEGDAAPSSDVDGREFAALTEIRINNSDVVGFAGLIRALNGNAVQDNSGLYTANGFSVTEIVRQGQLTPSGDATFGRFASSFSGDVPRSPFNDLGQFAFSVELFVDPAEIISGVFRASSSEIIELARQGDAYEEGALFNFQDPTLNNHGLVAFEASLNLGIENGPEGPFIVREDILIFTDGEDYATVVREGQQIGNRTVQDFFFNNTPLGNANGLSELGLVSYLAEYTDGSRAINVWRPELGWRGAENGQWDDEQNWAFAMTPNFASDISIDPVSAVEVQGPVDDVAVHSLSVGAGTGDVVLALGSGEIATESGITIGAQGTISGSGALRGSVVSDGSIAVDDNGTLLISGDVNHNGTIALGNNSQITISGIFSGTGLISGVDSTTIFDGVLAPGNSPGLLSVAGDVLLTDDNDTIFEIAGLTRGFEYDALDVGGMLTLDGTLSINLLNSYEPVAGDSYLLLQVGQLLGSFDVINLPEIAGLRLSLAISQNALSLDVQAVPIPAAIWLFGSSCLVLLRRQHARRN